MSEADYTSVVKTEPAEEDVSKELQLPQTIKAEPCFLDSSESYPNYKLEVPPIKTEDPDETIVKEEPIIENSHELLEAPKCGSKSELKDTPNEAEDVPMKTEPCSDHSSEIPEAIPYSSETIVKEEPIIEEVSKFPETAPIEVVPSPDQESKTAQLYSSESICKEELIIEDSNGPLLESHDEKCGQENESNNTKTSSVGKKKRHFTLMTATLQCATCGSFFATTGELLRHTLEHSATLQQSKKGKSSTDSETDQQPTLYRCPECPNAFLDRAACGRHIKRHEMCRAGKYQCNECGKCFGGPAVLRKHQSMHERMRAKEAAS